MSDVWVAGEVLIDLIPQEFGRREVVGGGPANTAKALAKLGITTQFINGISTDKYGQMALKQLQSDGVLLDYIKLSKKPTCLATVSITNTGQATYEFLIDETATFDYTPEWLPDPQLLKPTLLHIGTLVTAIEPAASVLHRWAMAVKSIAPIIFDPNVRPAVIKDRDLYVRQVERWIKISAAVKVSDDDIFWLYPGKSVDQVTNSWLRMGPELIVVTSGNKGITGFRQSEKVFAEALKVPVVDTVGAGDTVGAILVESIVKNGLSNLTGGLLKATLNRAAKAAAITVSRIGAQPPTLSEID